MFEIGWSELLLIAVVALIAIGPKELPTVLRTLGQWTSKLRRMASEFQSQFQEAMREAEMADLKKQVDDMTSQAHTRRARRPPPNPTPRRPAPRPRSPQTHLSPHRPPTTPSRQPPLPTP